MKQNLLGFLFVVRGVTPVLALLIIVWVTVSFFNDLRTTVRPQVQVIQTEITHLEDISTEAEQQWETLQNDITKLTSQIDKFHMPNLLPDLPEKLAIPLNIPDPTIPIPSGVDLKWKTASWTESVRVSESKWGFFGKALNWVTKQVGKTATYPSDLTFSTTDLSVEIPNANLPDLEIPMHLLKEPLGLLEGIFGPIENVFDSFNPVFSRLEKVKVHAEVIPNRLQTVALKGVNVLTLFLNTLGEWFIAVLAILGLFIVISLVGSMVTDLSYGLRLLFRPK